MAKKKKTLEGSLEEALVPVDEVPYKVPENWVWVRLDSISDKIRDGSHNPPPKKVTGIPMLSAKNIFNNSMNYETDRYISEEEYIKENARTSIEEGDILLTIVGTIGRSTIVEQKNPKFSLQRSVAVIKSMVNCKYVCYLFQSPVEQEFMLNNSKGTAQKGIYLNTVKKIPIPLPPLPDQKRIVQKIESLFYKLDKSKEVIEEARENFKNRKSAILAKAFRGELTKKWREENPDAESAEELLEKIEEEREKSNSKKKKANASENIDRPYELPEKWQWVSIGEIFDLVKDKVIPSEDKKYSYIGLEHMKKGGGILDISTTDGIKSSKTLFKENDVLYGRLRPYLNKHSIVKVGGVCSTDILVFRSNDYNISKFLDLYFSLPYVLNYAVENSKGINLPRVSGDTMLNLLIPCPPLEEQKQIVKILDTLLEEESKIEELTQLEDQIELIKKSILAKAFRGELGTNDLSEESALELLKDILKEKL